MEDIRFEKDRQKIRNNIRIMEIFQFLRKNWIKIIIILLVVLVIIFPSTSGHILGNWWDTFKSSFLGK